MSAAGTGGSRLKYTSGMASRTICNKYSAPVQRLIKADTIRDNHDMKKAHKYKEEFSNLMCK